MYACETCGEEFETLSRLRLEHDPCPVEERERRREAALRELHERGLAVGEECRLIASGEEVRIVDVEPGDGDEEPTVVWVPAGKPDAPEYRRTSPAGDVV